MLFPFNSDWQAFSLFVSCVRSGVYCCCKIIPDVSNKYSKESKVIISLSFLLKLFFCLSSPFIFKFPAQSSFKRKDFCCSENQFCKHVWFVFSVLSFLTALHSLGRPTGVCLILLLGESSPSFKKRNKQNIFEVGINISPLPKFLDGIAFRKKEMKWRGKKCCPLFPCTWQQ